PVLDGVARDIDHGQEEPGVARQPPARCPPHSCTPRVDEGDYESNPQRDDQQLLPSERRPGANSGRIGMAVFRVACIPTSQLAERLTVTGSMRELTEAVVVPKL